MRFTLDIPLPVSLKTKLWRIRPKYQENPKTLGQYILKMRIERGLYASELAKTIGCSGQTLFQWEKDYYLPEIRHLRGLHAEFNIPTNFLTVALLNRNPVLDEDKSLLFDLNRTQEAIRGCLLGQRARDGRLGRFLRILRLSRLQTALEFSQEIGVDKPTLWDWEIGRSYPSPKKIEELKGKLVLNNSEAPV